MKKCAKCGEVKELNNFTTDKSKPSGTRSRCKQCEKERHKIAGAKYLVKNRKKIYAYRDLWKKNNKDKVATSQRKYIKSKVVRLTDAYVRHLLTVGTILKSYDIPQELIEAKRVHMQLLRRVENERHK